MRTLALLLCAAAMSMPSLPAIAQTPAPTELPSAKIDADMAAALAAHRMRGATIAILRGDTQLYTKAYGSRDDANKLPATIDTKYQFGSITKQFTAAAVLQLVDAGKIELDAPLATYLPHAPHAREVTIREMLSHTSGLPEYLDGDDVIAAAAKPASVDHILKRIAGKPLDFKPGTQWEYSNTNYLLLGRVIEVASGKPYEDYMRSQVFARAGLPQLATIGNEPHLANLSQGYAGNKPAPPLDNSWAWSAGNIVGTVSDLAHWDAMLASGKVVSRSAYVLMTSPQTPPGGTQYGFGFIIDRHDDQQRIWHNGGTFGFNTSDQFYPAQNLRIIVFTNEASGTADELAGRIFDDIYPQLAVSRAPVSGEDAALTARFKRVTLDIIAGRVDRDEFDANANKALTDQLVTQASQEFEALGAAHDWIYKGVQTSGNARIYTYLVDFSAATMMLTVGMDPDGKINELYLSHP